MNLKEYIEVTINGIEKQNARFRKVLGEAAEKYPKYLKNLGELEAWNSIRNILRNKGVIQDEDEDGKT